MVFTDNRTVALLFFTVTGSVFTVAFHRMVTNGGHALVSSSDIL